MRLEWIDDILAVLDTGSLAQAAERRFLTQSAFTRRVRQIEESIGATLFDRRRKPVTLLPGVQALEPELRDLGARLRRLRQDMKTSANQARGALGFACQHAITTTVSPWIVRALAADGGPSVRVKSGNLDECLMLLLSHEVDFAVMYELPVEGASLPARAFDAATIGADVLVPVAAPSMVEAVRSRLIPVIGYPSDVFLGQVFDRRIAPRLPEGTATEIRAETALTLAAYQFALGGIGIAWLPQSLALPGLAEGTLLRVDDHLPVQALDIRMYRLAESRTAENEAVWQTMSTRLELPPELQRLPDELSGLVKPVE